MKHTLQQTAPLTFLTDLYILIPSLFLGYISNILLLLLFGAQPLNVLVGNFCCKLNSYVLVF